MKKILQLLLVICLTSLIACEKASTTIPDTPSVSGNLIQFDNLQVGQKSVYIKAISCQHYIASDTTFKMTQDTLTLEIMSKDGNGYLVKESVNQSTPYCYKGTVGYPMPYVFYLNKVGDSLIMKVPINSDSRVSQIFSFNLPLKAVTTNAKMLNKWLLPELSSTNYWGFVDNVIRNNTNLGTATIWWHGSATVVDGPYNGLVYNSKYGIIARIGLGSMLPVGSIWYLKP
jgi:hypothetical protein